MKRLLACALCALLCLAGCSTGNYTIPGSSVTKKKASSKSKAAAKSSVADKNRIRTNFLKNLKKENASAEKKAKHERRHKKKDSVSAWKSNVHPPKDQRYITNYFSR